MGYDLDVPKLAVRRRGRNHRVGFLTRCCENNGWVRASAAPLRIAEGGTVSLSDPCRSLRVDAAATAAGTRLRAGEGYSGALSLRRLLMALGDLPATNEAAISGEPALDPPLIAALTRFQARHGLDPDGVLGRSTFRALTTPFDSRAQQIALSLERVRWLPARMDSPPIIVNVPQFRLFAFRTTADLAQDIRQMDVIVGSSFKGRQTPVFRRRTCVSRGVATILGRPPHILMKELMPQIKANPDWIAESDYEIVQAQGDDASAVAPTAENIRLLAAGKLRLRQKPGPTNALGHVKFIFPQSTQCLSARHCRAGSVLTQSPRVQHGCIRVADPMGLLAHVLRNEPQWTEARVAEALQRSTPTRVPLTHPIRVFILYGTALATEAGATLFFDDIYDQDARLTHLSRRGARGSLMTMPPELAAIPGTPVVDKCRSLRWT